MATAGQLKNKVVVIQTFVRGQRIRKFGPREWPHSKHPMGFAGATRIERLKIWCPIWCPPCPPPTKRSSKSKSKSKVKKVRTFKPIPSGLISVANFNPELAGMIDGTDLVWAENNDTPTILIRIFRAFTASASTSTSITMKKFIALNSFTKNFSATSKLRKGTIVALSARGRTRIETRPTDPNGYEDHQGEYEDHNEVQWHPTILNASSLTPSDFVAFTGRKRHLLPSTGRKAAKKARRTHTRPQQRNLYLTAISQRS